jgi:hypothetical protein
VNERLVGIGFPNVGAETTAVHDCGYR